VASEDRTFSESWYRVAELRPRLRATVQTSRQHFRGRIWHVVQDPTNNSFFRLHPAGYRFVAMLDGRRTVSAAWRSCLDTLGDEAVTQNEAIQVLGQLYAANLLQGDLPPDAEGLFQRYRKRRSREVKGQLANFLFLRVPLFDPDRLLNALLPVAGLAFTPVGFVVWLGVVMGGALLALGSWRELTGQAETLLNAKYLAGNLPLMYGAFVLAKVFHEFGHAFACKKFGRRQRAGGEVHVMGVMFLVLVPMPYVDASSAWMLRRKLHRAIIGAAGMMTELVLASVAVVVWVWTAGAAEPWQRGVHAVAFNLMFIASAATLLFNANFLLRFDGYYILSDLLGIPNLSARSRQYVRYLVKRFAWGVRRALNPANSPGEAVWLTAYGAAATAFRIFICVKILLMLTERFFFVGVVLAAAAAVVWVLVPLGRFVHYLLASPELARVRIRALAVTVLLGGGPAAALGLVSAPDRWRIEGVVEPARIAFVHAGADGFVRHVLPSQRRVAPADPNGSGTALLMAAENRELQVQWRKLHHERDVLEARQRIARLKSTTDSRYLAMVQILQEDLDDLARQEEMLRQEIAALSVEAPFAGTWVSKRAERLQNAYVRRGEQVGLVASLDDVVIRANPTHRLAGMLNAEADRTVEIRLVGRPAMTIQGTWKDLPAGRRGQPWTARPQAGQIARPRDDQEMIEREFGIEIAPVGPGCETLLPGQRVFVRFRMPPKSLLSQWWRSLRQLAQRRFRI